MSMNSEITGNRRFSLDGPPPQPDQRPAPPAMTPEMLYDSSSGAVSPEAESSATGDMGVDSIASAFAELAEVEEKLTALSTRFPRLYPIMSDFLTVMRQALPQEISSMLSMSPMSAAGAPGNTTNQLSALFGGGGDPSAPAPIAGPPAMGGMPPGAGGVMG